VYVGSLVRGTKSNQTKEFACLRFVRDATCSILWHCKKGQTVAPFSGAEATRRGWVNPEPWRTDGQTEPTVPCTKSNPSKVAGVPRWSAGGGALHARLLLPVTLTPCTKKQKSSASQNSAVMQHLISSAAAAGLWSAPCLPTRAGVAKRCGARRPDGTGATPGRHASPARAVSGTTSASRGEGWSWWPPAHPPTCWLLLSYVCGMALRLHGNGWQLLPRLLAWLTACLVPVRMIKKRVISRAAQHDEPAGRTRVAPGEGGSTSLPMCACGPRPCVGGEAIHLPAGSETQSAHSLSRPR